MTKNNLAPFNNKPLASNKIWNDATCFPYVYLIGYKNFDYLVHNYVFDVIRIASKFLQFFLIVY